MGFKTSLFQEVKIDFSTVYTSRQEQLLHSLYSMHSLNNLYMLLKLKRLDQRFTQALQPASESVLPRL